jgi:hypothetical protein
VDNHLLGMLALYGWMSRKMLEAYSHTRMEAKRQAVSVFDVVENSEGGTKFWIIESRFRPVSDAYARMIHPAEGCGKGINFLRETCFRICLAELISGSAPASCGSELRASPAGSEQL